MLGIYERADSRSNRAETITRVRELLRLATPVAEAAVKIDPPAAQPLAQPCPCCGGRMVVIETFEVGCQQATVQPRLSSQSGSTPHERGRHITHLHRQARFSLVKTRPRRRSTRQLPGSAFHSASFPQSHRHRRSSEPETHQRPPSPDRHALAPRVHRQHRDQIAIAHAAPSAHHLSRVLSLEAFGPRPQCKPKRRDGPSSETLHNKRHRLRMAAQSAGIVN
jgi:hypothetical protein